MNYITTSRKPGTNVRCFARELGTILNASYLTRGKASMSDLISSARYNAAQSMFIVTEESGNPHQILEIEVEPKNWKFTNTYIVTLHRLRKTLTDEKYHINNIQFGELSRSLHHLIKGGHIFSNDKSEFELRETDGVASVYLRNKEIGPRFKVFYEDDQD